MADHRPGPRLLELEDRDARTFGTTGIPKRLLTFSQQHHAEYYGRGFSKLGLIADPGSADGMPVGLAPSDGDTLAFTCAACHFGQLPDGRYAVGFGNTRFEYGRFIASLGASLLLSFDAEDPKVAPSVRSLLRSHVTAARERPGYDLDAAAVGVALLVRGQALPFSVEAQERHLHLPAGVMDFLTPPLLDDGVWAPSRVLSLWNLPSKSERDEAHMPSEMLSWNGGVPTLDVFLQGFVALGFGREQSEPERFAPLREYVQQLRAPTAPEPPDLDGGRLFSERGCRACHSGPGGEGSRVFAFSEIGTDAAYAQVYGPKADGTACCGLDAGSKYLTRGIKAPRLVGVWTATRLLHDGSVSGLEELFCESPRSARGHPQTCDGLTDSEKHALIRFLRAW